MSSETASDATPPTFDALPLSPDVRRAVDELGYVHPTPVQRAVFEPASRGTDLVVQARTGTGKTAAFGLPIVDSIVKKSVGKVQALVLCPTRELALQVSREVTSLGKHRGIKVAAVYGGAPMPKQVQAIQDGAQIVVGTPGRVLDHLRRGTLDATPIRMFVLDESDEMLSMGFLPQINEIMGFLNESRQVLLFSATLPPAIQKIAEDRLRSPEFITLSGDHIGALEIQHYVYLSHGDKPSELVQILEVENPESAIIFCNTRDDTKRVTSALGQEGYDADWLNADLGQNEREKVMARTREGKLRFLVATDVAARGIDISHLTHVINYDLPESAEQYVHRTGRTGRAGRTGTAISLIEPKDIGNLYYLRLTYKIDPIEKQLPTPQDLKTRAEMDVVQMFVGHFAKTPVHEDDLSMARRLLTHEEAERIVAGLIRSHLGARPGAIEQASAERRAKPPKAVTDEATEGAESERSSRRRRGRRRGADRPRDEEAGSAARDEQASSAALQTDSPPADATRKRAPNRSTTSKREASAPETASTARSTDGDGPATKNRSASDAKKDFAEIYVNIGRRDGAKASDFYTALEERGGVTIDDTDYVNVRQRHSFIGVRRDYVDRAVEALDGAEIAGRQASAELSRSRPRDASA